MSETNMMGGGDHFHKKPKPFWFAYCGVGWFACGEWSEFRDDKRRQFCPKCKHLLVYIPAKRGNPEREDGDE